MRDAVVVGGGPAGLAVALELRQRGLSVTVVDGAWPPIDKACGEGIMPDGVARLQGLGVFLDPAEASPFRGIRFVDAGAEDSAATADFPSGPGLAVRRTHLHERLAERAAAAGVELLWGVRAQGLTARGLATAGREIEARFILGADGLHSSVRRWTGLAGRPAAIRRFGVRRHFAVSAWTEHVEVHWVDGCEAYVTPVGAERVGVALLWQGAPARYEDLLRRFPRLAERLAGAAPVSQQRGAGPLRQRVRGVVRGRVALLGDASGYLDAISGEGLALALHQAAALATAIAADDLSGYVRAHRRLARRADLLTHLMLLAARRPAVRRRMIRTLAADPVLFARLLGVHTRALPVTGVGLYGALRLASCLLVAPSAA